MNGAEVVKVNYDSEKISKAALVKHARLGNCTLVNKLHCSEKIKTPQYYLKNSSYKYLPLTATQKTKINSAIHNNKNPVPYLSPSQRKWFADLDKYNSRKTLWYEKPFQEAWSKMK